MLRKALLSAAVALVCVAPLQADLKYTVRMELKKSATPVLKTRSPTASM